jgi:hypothetical protein
LAPAGTPRDTTGHQPRHPGTPSGQHGATARRRTGHQPGHHRDTTGPWRGGGGRDTSPDTSRDTGGATPRHPPEHRETSRDTDAARPGYPPGHRDTSQDTSRDPGGATVRRRRRKKGGEEDTGPDQWPGTREDSRTASHGTRLPGWGSIKDSLPQPPIRGAAFRVSKVRNCVPIWCIRIQTATTFKGTAHLGCGK